MINLEYCDITIKNHKRYNKKILFVIFKECYIDDPEKIKKIITEYHRIIEENKGISSVIDTRAIKGYKNTLAFSQGKELKKYDSLVRKNLISLSIIIDNMILENLVRAVARVQPFVIPTKIIKTNSEALAFLTENFNKTDE